MTDEHAEALATIRCLSGQWGAMLFRLLDDNDVPRRYVYPVAMITLIAMLASCTNTEDDADTVSNFEAGLRLFRRDNSSDSLH